MCTEKIIQPLNELGVDELDRKSFFFVEAADPDDACYKALNKLKTRIIEQNLTDEIVDYLEDELHNDTKVISLRGVKPH
jgi:2,3-bisphosphoglycerate-independent phosphoglycerate mutase|tara:strand:- start:740 stop:976 length:237 start_codon:yes stop_codon:yes gene_type:complete